MRVAQPGGPINRVFCPSFLPDDAEPSFQIIVVLQYVAYKMEKVQKNNLTLS
jgi:hypothetical protein